MNHAERAEEVHLQLVARLTQGNLFDCTDEPVASVIDQHVDRADIRDHCLDGLGIAHIQYPAPSSPRCQRFEGGLQTRVAQSSRDLIARRERGFCDCTTKASADSGDEPCLQDTTSANSNKLP